MLLENNLQRSSQTIQEAFRTFEQRSAVFASVQASYAPEDQKLVASYLDKVRQLKHSYEEFLLAHPQLSPTQRQSFTTRVANIGQKFIAQDIELFIDLKLAPQKREMQLELNEFEFSKELILFRDELDKTQGLEITQGRSLLNLTEQLQSENNEVVRHEIDRLNLSVLDKRKLTAYADGLVQFFQQSFQSALVIAQRTTVDPLQYNRLVPVLFLMNKGDRVHFDMREILEDEELKAQARNFLELFGTELEFQDIVCKSAIDLVVTSSLKQDFILNFNRSDFQKQFDVQQEREKQFATDLNLIEYDRLAETSDLSLEKGLGQSDAQRLIQLIFYGQLGKSDNLIREFVQRLTDVANQTQQFTQYSTNLQTTQKQVCCCATF